MNEIKVGMTLYRNGEAVNQVVWDLGFTDSWIGDYLLMVRQIPYAPWDDEDPLVVCRVPRDVLKDMTELLTQRRFDVCRNVCDSWEGFNLAEYDAAAQTGAQLQKMVLQYREGDELRYYSNE